VLVALWRTYKGNWTMANPKKVDKKYDTIIIDPDLDSRMRLKQAMTAVYNFGKSHQVVSLDEALSRLRGSDNCDVIFISYRFEQKEVAQFIKNAKETKNGMDAAYVLVMKTKNQDTSTVAQNVMSGADGFLFEPYSVDLLLEITQLSAKVKVERAATREKAAINLLVQDVIGQIDQVSYIKSCQIDIGASMKKLRDLCAVFQGLDAEKLNLYYESALKCFEDAPIPKNVFQHKKYGGVSSRIKKKMEEKILADIAKTENKKAHV
jgi:CheY-like chemotaxis protein